MTTPARWWSSRPVRRRRAGAVTPNSSCWLTCVTEHQALLVLMQRKCGMYAPETWFAYMHYGVTPDIPHQRQSVRRRFSAERHADHAGNRRCLGLPCRFAWFNPMAAIRWLVRWLAQYSDIINTPEVLQGIHTKRQQFVQHLQAIDEQFGHFQRYSRH